MQAKKLKRAALIAEILGGTAVVISVIYLALQISDNNRLLRSQAHYNALDQLQRPLEAMLESDSLAEILNRCNHEPRDVSDSLWSRCANYYFLEINGWEYAFYQNIDESIPPELWAGVDGHIGALVQEQAGYARFWEETGRAFGEPFRSHVEGLVQNNPAYRQSKE